METSKIRSYTKDAQTVKEMTLNQLLKDGVISASDYDTYTERYQIIVTDLTWFEKWCSKFKNETKEDEFSYKMVKFEN